MSKSAAVIRAKLNEDYYMRRIERCTCPRCGAVHNKKLEAGR